MLFVRRLATGFVSFALAALSASAHAQRDSSASLKHAVAAEVQFLARWDTAWRATGIAHRFFALPRYNPLLPALPAYLTHCHPDFVDSARTVTDHRLIGSRLSWFSVCPSWNLGLVPYNIDERLTVDEALNTDTREGIRAARSVLIATLDSAATIDPKNDFIVGQRVRFLLDQRDMSRAYDVALACSATKWWCSALAGYVYNVIGQPTSADSAYHIALDAMPSEQRCAWTDQRTLFDPARRGKYASFSCAQRDSANAWLWWLARPLFIDTVTYNAREVEQYSRDVLLALRTALPRDERYNWSDRSGGDARRAMVLRFGWPSQVVWGGPENDREHTGYLMGRAGSAASEPYTTYEYGAHRLHLVPEWSAVADPFHAKPGDWTLSAPDVPPPAPPRNGIPQTLPWWPANVSRWWPIEHFAPEHVLVQLPEGQRVILRRQDSVLLAVATDMPSAGKLNDQLDGPISHMMLVSSDRPGAVTRLGEFTAYPGETAIASAMIPSRPAIIGLEFAPVGEQLGGRLRYGITPPPPLSAMRTGEVAVSDPVLIVEPMSDSEVLPSDPLPAIHRMIGTPLLSKAGKVGVYWETYGLAPSDSVEFAVWIERFTPQGLARRFGIAIHIATDLNTPVAMSWHEPQTSGNRTIVQSGPVQIMGHSVTIDSSKLPPGEYWLDVAVRKPGRDAVRGRTSFVVK